MTSWTLRPTFVMRKAYRKRSTRSSWRRTNRYTHPSHLHRCVGCCFHSLPVRKTSGRFPLFFTFLGYPPSASPHFFAHLANTAPFLCVLKTTAMKKTKKKTARAIYILFQKNKIIVQIEDLDGPERSQSYRVDSLSPRNRKGKDDEKKKKMK